MNKAGGNLLFAIAASLLVHALLAGALIAYLEYGPRPETLATLDLSSVELSFAEKEDDSAAIAPMPASAPVAKPPEPPSTDADVHSPSASHPHFASRPEPPSTDEAVRCPSISPPRFETSSAPPQAAVAPRQAKVDAPPSPKRAIRPDYPRGARQRGEQGSVVVEIRVDEKGHVDEVKVVTSSGFPELDEAAVKAAKAAKFSPARSGKSPVTSTARLKLQFKLK